MAEQINITNFDSPILTKQALISNADLLTSPTSGSITTFGFQNQTYQITMNNGVKGIALQYADNKFYTKRKVSDTQFEGPIYINNNGNYTDLYGNSVQLPAGYVVSNPTGTKKYFEIDINSYQVVNLIGAATKPTGNNIFLEINQNQGMLVLKTNQVIGYTDGTSTPNYTNATLLDKQFEIKLNGSTFNGLSYTSLFISQFTINKTVNENVITNLTQELVKQYDLLGMAKASHIDISAILSNTTVEMPSLSFDSSSLWSAIKVLDQRTQQQSTSLNRTQINYDEK